MRGQGNYMDQFEGKAQELRTRVEGRVAEMKGKIPFLAQSKLGRKGGRLTVKGVRSRGVGPSLKSRFPQLRGMKIFDMVGTRRGLRENVPLLNRLVGPRTGRVPPGERQAPSVADETREPRPANGYNISVSL